MGNAAAEMSLACRRASRAISCQYCCCSRCCCACPLSPPPPLLLLVPKPPLLPAPPAPLLLLLLLRPAAVAALTSALTTLNCMTKHISSLMTSVKITAGKEQGEQGQERREGGGDREGRLGVVNGTAEQPAAGKWVAL